MNAPADCTTTLRDIAGRYPCAEGVATWLDHIGERIDPARVNANLCPTATNYEILEYLEEYDYADDEDTDDAYVGAWIDALEPGVADQPIRLGDILDVCGVDAAQWAISYAFGKDIRDAFTCALRNHMRFFNRYQVRDVSMFDPIHYVDFQVWYRRRDAFTRGWIAGMYTTW